MAMNAIASTIDTTRPGAASLNARSALKSSDAEMIGNRSATTAITTNHARRDRFGTSMKLAAATASQMRFNVSSIACTVYDELKYQTTARIPRDADATGSHRLRFSFCNRSTCRSDLA